MRVRYKQTVIGVGWALLQPLMTMAIFSIVFGRLAKIPSDGYPYPVFVLSGLLPWMFFAAAVGASSNSLIGSSNLISKVYFPRIIVPAASLGVPLLDFAISGTFLLGMELFLGLRMGPWLLSVFVPMAFLLLLTLGIGMLLSALAVVYRDVRNLVPFLLQVWMFATPVVYPPSLVPSRWHWVLAANPMAGLVEAFRYSLLGRTPDLALVLPAAALSVGFFAVGVWYFGRVERRFADVI